MAFASLGAFFAMGGHGPYVWAAWGVTALLMAACVIHARLERRQLARLLMRRARRGSTSQPHQASHADDP
ncbi:heme exporter protein CcmD [Halomonas aquamarina]|uniref:Heme exporter protein CcmD n=1 Tax=Vreelandella aquamarina TaxID=77097 RepID=A0ACC5VSI8_9GAMM|nr:heme exporter protein CcmD [Halomonas aquamarina]MBZ5487220.1 heme exporter protein CcmD [Halomonas aquamarina]